MFIWLCCQQASPPPHTALTPMVVPSLILLPHRSDCALILCHCSLGDSCIYRTSQKVGFDALRAIPVTSDFSFQPSILTSSICWELTMHLIFFLCKVSVGARSKGFPKFFEKSDSFQRRCCHFFTAQSWTSSLDKPGLFPFAPYCT